MIYGLYQSAAGMMVNEYRQDVLANNIANAETPGFKREIAAFAERDPASVAGRRFGPSNELLDPLTGGIWLGETVTDFQPGRQVRTGNATDVALLGDGFFVVEKGGEDLFTRDGRFVVDPNGALVAATDGAPVRSVTGAPIFVHRDGGELNVAKDGRVFQDGALLGQLAIADFDNYAALKKVGTNRWANAGGARPITSAAEFRGGYYEDSGAEPIKELVTMIESARAYQFNARLVSLQDQTIGRIITAVSR